MTPLIQLERAPKQSLELRRAQLGKVAENSDRAPQTSSEHTLPTSASCPHTPHLDPTRPLCAGQRAEHSSDSVSVTPEPFDR